MLVNNLKQNKTQTSTTKNEALPAEKYFSSPAREWTNSIYSFNINTLKTIPYAEVLALKVIKIYFSFFNKTIEKLVKTKWTLRRFKKYSSNKIYISKGEFKHTNNKVLINLYLFNRKKHNYILFMKKWYHRFLSKKLSKLFIRRLNIVNRNLSGIMLKNDINKDSLARLLNTKSTNLNLYMYKFYKMALNKSIRRIKTYFYYKQLLYINRSITNYNFLHKLQNYLECIYNKNVEFNLINLKRFFLNSDILSESVTLKITRNRKKMRRYLKLIRNKVKLYKEKDLSVKSSTKPDLELKRKVDLESTVLKILIFRNIKYKRVTGFRIESKGRLTRRYTASRSVNIVRYKGNLLDMDSSFKRISTPVLRGVIKSNLQTTKLKSKTRIGSFGIKGWISGN